MNREDEDLLEVGTIIGTHGLRGDLKIRLASDDPELFGEIARVCLRLPDGKLQHVTIVKQMLHKGRLVLRFQDYESINAAEPLIGSHLLLEQGQLPALAEDEFYWGQLEGLRVIDRERGPLGLLQGMFTNPAHDTYVVAGDNGEILIPAVKQFIQDIDLEKRVMHVDLPDGLVPEEQ